MADRREKRFSDREVAIPLTVLVARDEFLRGLARLVEFGRVFERVRRYAPPSRDTSEALAADWAHVGHDLARSLDRAAEKERTEADAQHCVAAGE